jgi:hypothetical protein
VQGEALLTTIAEISVAFAGFSGLIAIFSSTSGHGPQLAAFPQFWFMIEVSLATLFFSLLPLLLGEVGVPPRSVWAISSLALAPCLALYWLRVLRPHPELPAERRPPPALWISFAIASSALFVALLLNGLGILIDRQSWPFLVALMLMLGGTATSFFFLLWHLRSSV